MCHAAGVPASLSPAAVKNSRAALTAVVAVSVVGWTLLVLAAWQGWLGPQAGRGAEFCEAARVGWIKQPINTWSNGGFTIAGLAVAWHVDRSSGSHRTTMAGFAVIIALLGPASAAMHATETAVGGQLDLLSMYLLSSFAAAQAVVRSGRLARVWFGALFLALVVLCEAVGAIPVSLPVLMRPGNAIFAILLLTAVLLELGLVRAGRAEVRWGLASLGTLLLAFVIWNLSKDGSPLCDPLSMLQGHGAWHLLDALAAYFLARHYLSPGRGRGSSPR